MRKVSEANRKIWSGWSFNLRESRYKKVAKLVLEENPGKLLDIGCSSADFSSSFVGLGWDVYGVEIAANKAKEAKAKGIKAVVGDFAKQLPFKDGFFDVVFAGEVIEHVVDTDSFLKEAGRVLKTGGKLILTTPNLTSLENRIRILLGVYPIWVDYRLGGAGHIRGYTPSTLKRQLRQHGFRIERHLGNFVPPISQAFLDDTRFPPLGLTGYVLPCLSQGIIIKARKV